MEVSAKERNQFVAVARIVRPQGRRGEVLADILTDFPQRFETANELFLENPDQAPERVTLENAWLHKGRVVLKLSGVDSIEQAERLRDRHVLIRPEERTPLPPRHYYVGDLTGCRVVREHQGSTSEVGTVTEVEHTGGVDLLHVETPRGDVLIPLAEAICTKIDPDAKTIVINPPEDLLELNL